MQTAAAPLKAQRRAAQGAVCRSHHGAARPRGFTRGHRLPTRRFHLLATIATFLSVEHLLLALVALKDEQFLKVVELRQARQAVRHRALRERGMVR